MERWHFFELEVQLQGKLHDARIARGGYCVKQSRREGGRCATDWVGVVKGIERLHSELTGESFGELYVLEQRQVRLPEARCTDCARTLSWQASLANQSRGEG